MELLEDLVFLALGALFLLTLLLFIIWIIRCCRTKSNESLSSEIGKESSSSTSTALDFTGNILSLFFQLKIKKFKAYSKFSDDDFQDDEVFTLPETKKLKIKDIWKYPET